MKSAALFSSPSWCNLNENLSHCRNGRSRAGCISRILRRILCFSSRPLCSFNHFNEDEREKSALNGASGAAPGIVARLMGLESIPRIEPVEESPSMSSADSFKKSTSSPQVRRPRIIPAYQELQDEKFFILSFEKGGTRRESRVQRRKSSKNSVKMEQSMRDKCKKESVRSRESLEGKNKENEEVNMILIGDLDDFQAENPGNVLRVFNYSCQKPEETRRKKTRRENSLAAAIIFEAENDSENSSPNSVLEFAGFTTDQESASSGEISRLANSKMRRPLSDELDNCGNSMEKKLINNGNGEKEQLSSRLRNRHQNYAEKWDEIRNLAAMETIKSSWLSEGMSNDQHFLMEIGRDLASDILDQLLDELLINLENFDLDTVIQISSF